MTGSGEHELIARYFRPLARDPGAFDLIDDAAILTPPEGRDLVLTKDGIAEGVHFLAGEPGEAVAKKALRVNLSDLAAKGADPVGYLVLLGLPKSWTETWVAAFAAGLADDQKRFGISLLGGDTIRAAGLTVSITAVGSLPAGSTVRRSGARAGDAVYVSGTIGDGALGLLAAREEGDVMRRLARDHREILVARYRQPEPRTTLAAALRNHATAALDVSDGLAGDLDKLCQASGVSARIELARVPLSAAAQSAISVEPTLVETCMTGGDDYEILCTVPRTTAEPFEAEAAEAGVRVTRIGEIVAGREAAVFLGEDGGERRFSRRSFSHIG